jgi:hypothetical protein
LPLSERAQVLESSNSSVDIVLTGEETLARCSFTQVAHVQRDVGPSALVVPTDCIVDLGKVVGDESPSLVGKAHTAMLDARR